MRSRFIFGCWFFCSIHGLMGQLPTGQSLSVGVYGGKVLKHTPKLAFNVPTVSWGASLHWQSQLYGKEAWQSWHHYPKPGIIVQFFEFGSPDTLGRAFSVAPSLNVHILKYRGFGLQFEVASGAAWLTRPYNSITNRANNAVSSNLNSTTQLGFVLDGQITPVWVVSVGARLTHYSNGSSSLPNYGINVGTLNLGLCYTPKPVRRSDYIEAPEAILPHRRWGVDASVGIAWQESMIPDGPKYPVYLATLEASWLHRPSGRWLAGVGFEYVTSVYKFTKHLEAFETDKEMRQNATRKLVIAGHESLYGAYGVLLQVGTYFSKNPILGPPPLFEKLTLRRYFYLQPARIGGGLLHFGISIKAHKINADYISFELGGNF